MENQEEKAHETYDIDWACIGDSRGSFCVVA